MNFKKLNESVESDTFFNNLVHSYGFKERDPGFWTVKGNKVEEVHRELINDGYHETNKARFINGHFTKYNNFMGDVIVVGYSKRSKDDDITSISNRSHLEKILPEDFSASAYGVEWLRSHSREGQEFRKRKWFNTEEEAREFANKLKSKCNCKVRIFKARDFYPNTDVEELDEGTFQDAARNLADAVSATSQAQALKKGASKVKNSKLVKGIVNTYKHGDIVDAIEKMIKNASNVTELKRDVAKAIRDQKESGAITEKDASRLTLIQKDAIKKFEKKKEKSKQAKGRLHEEDEEAVARDNNKNEPIAYIKID